MERVEDGHAAAAEAFRLEHPVATHLALAASAVLGALLFLGVYEGWLGFRGADLPKPLRIPFSESADIVLPVVLVLAIAWVAGVLAAVPSEVRFAADGRVLFRAPLRTVVLAPGDRLTGSRNALGMWLLRTGGGKAIVLLPPVFDDEAALLDRIKGRLTPP